MLSTDEKPINHLTIEIGSERQYLNRLLKSNRDEKGVWLVVKNEGMPVSHCRVLVEGFEYYFLNEWIIAPNGYERKALKWGASKNTIEGRVDIATKGSRKIEIAKARRRPNPHFELTYHEGATGKTHHFIGKYKLRVKIEAKTEREGSTGVIEPVFYDIYFDYESTLKINIEDIVRLALPDPA